MGVIQPNPKVQTIDGATSIQNVKTIKVTNGDLSVSAPSRTATIDTGGSGAATITENQIGYGDAANLLTSSLDFMFVPDTGAGPTLGLSGDRPVFTMSDNTGPTTYSAELHQSGASLYAFMKSSGGLDTEIFRLTNTEFLINDDGEDRNFRIETDGQEYMFSVDGGNNNIGIGAAPNSAVERLHVTGADADKDLILLESTDTDGNSDGPDVVLYRSKDSPGDGVQLGSIKFRGRNNTPGDVEYAQVEAEIESGFAGSENGSLRFGATSDGVMYNAITIDGTASRPITHIYGRAFIAYDGVNNARLTFEDNAGGTDSYIQESGYDLSITGNSRIQLNAGDKIMCTTDLSVYTADHSTLQVHIGNDALDTATFNHSSSSTYDFKVNMKDCNLFADSGNDILTLSPNSTNDGGFIAPKILHAKTDDHTIVAGECYGSNFVMTATGKTLTLPAAKTGMHLKVMTSAQPVTIACDGSETINGSADIDLNIDYSVMDIICWREGYWLGSNGSVLA